MSKNMMYLYGKNPVIERLKADPTSVKKVILKEDFDDKRVLDLLKKTGVKFEFMPKNEFMRQQRADRVQGVIALIDKFAYANFDELVSKPAQKPLTFVFLDNLNDPQNLGVIIRSLACFGGFAVVIPKHESCEVTEAVLHVASGGENYVPVCMVTNMTAALLKAKEHGYWVAGTVVEGGQDLKGFEFMFPICLLMGSEGKGIRPGLMNHIDFKVTLPMHGSDLSFNVAVATAIFCYEIARQRKS